MGAKVLLRIWVLVLDCHWLSVGFAHRRPRDCLEIPNFTLEVGAFLKPASSWGLNNEIRAEQQTERCKSNVTNSFQSFTMQLAYACEKSPGHEETGIAIVPASLEKKKSPLGKDLFQESHMEKRDYSSNSSVSLGCFHSVSSHSFCCSCTIRT